MAAKKSRSITATTRPSVPTKSAQAPSRSKSVKMASGVALDPLTTASHYRALRKQHEGEAAQDYCEAIADLLAAGVEARVGRIAERFGLSHVTVSRVVRRLASEGLVDARALGVLRVLVVLGVLSVLDILSVLDLRDSLCL